MPLTDLSIKALKPTGARYRKADGGGLFIEVNPNGGKVFRLAYRFGGMQRTLVVGRYPEMKLASARYIREQAKQSLRLGIDPSTSTNKVAEVPVLPIQDPADPKLWVNLIRAYLAKRKREGAARLTISKLTLHAEATIPVMGNKLVELVDAQDVIKACQPYEAAGKLNSAHSVRALCSQVFRYAIALGFARHDPAAPARDALARLQDSHHAGIVDHKRLGELMRAIRGYDGNPVVRAALLLSAYLFPRNSELRGMRWDQIDITGAMWTVPSEQMKKNREHLVPLPRQAVAIIAAVRPYTGKFARVLHSRTSGSGMLSDNTFNKAMRAMGFGATEHVHHGFRTTASTLLNEKGWNFDWIERQLAHVEENKIRGAYNKALYLPGRIEMMQAYADLLDELAAR